MTRTQTLAVTITATAALLLTLAPAGLAEVEYYGNLEVQQLNGPGRAETATAISAAQFEPGVPAVFIATGDTFADALAGGPAAALEGGPILLSRKASLPPTTINELVRLQPERIVVLGGAAAISDDVVDALGVYTSGTVTRLAGADRYGTAAAVARALFADVETVYVGTGFDWPDALAGGAAAAHDGAPLLLTRTNSIPAATILQLRRMSPARIVVLGGVTSVSERVERQLAGYASDEVLRLGAGSRFDTAAAISAATFPAGVRSVYVTTGGDFPDALTGVPAAAREGSPVLLLTGHRVPASVEAELTRLEPQRLVILGGPAAVSAQVRMQLFQILAD